MQCNKCGKEISSNSVYCSHCGEKVEKLNVPKSDKKICKKCGKENEDIYMFCSGCGSLLDDFETGFKENTDEDNKVIKKTCKSCGKDVDKDASFCPHCGKNPNEEIKKYCPNCGMLNPDENNYCLRCGTELNKNPNANNQPYNNIHIKHNTKIKTSVCLILGIISLLLSPGVISTALSIISLVFFSKEKTTHPKEQRIVGLILSIIALVITVVAFISSIISLINGNGFDEPGYFY